MVFEHAVAEMEQAERPLYGPESFRDYVARHDVDAGSSTPRYISVDSISDLAPELRANDVMVLRLGAAPEGTGTAFLLVDAPGGVEEFFLRDEELFADHAAERFESPIDRTHLLGFELLPSLSETSLVNLGLASGVLAETLDLDTAGALAPPATGVSTFTFSVEPHSDLAETVVHRNGQVEIDTLFAERRDGELVLCVIEAKTGPRASLAKHKLVYPVLALGDAVPPDIEILPVYLRCRRTGETITFDVAECTIPDPRTTVPAIDELVVTRTRVLELDLG